MKKLVIIAVAVVFVFAFVSTALAAGGITPVDNTTAPLTGLPDASGDYNQGGYMQPTAGQNPHGGYTTNTNKCKVCHAVHGAAPSPGQALLRSSRADACVFCHVSGSFSIAQPYGTDPLNYTTEYENNHASGHQSTTYNGCVSCHSVHGANTIGGGLAAYILKVNPGGALTANPDGALTGSAATLDDFCRDCHDGTTRATSAWTPCGDSCHATQMEVSNPDTRNFVSHIMTTTLTGSTGVTVSQTASTTCRSCHKGGSNNGVASNGNDFPHFTSGADFLMDSHTSTSPLDRVCVDCHQWAVNQGVGSTF